MLKYSSEQDAIWSLVMAGWLGFFIGLTISSLLDDKQGYIE